ncbi:hypothetical protein [Jeotgalibacillus haloalkalitolerans]|uniref:Phage protein n=1 Tax=Jeotgalibacillus haloalkalitolerans TaxID=3104292 RepID=A0ABU5KLW9_9BACL|nr:hypothetical protein [Jeotgalibacillus sp. HH7-29]MDZ5712254.1 hypothetical protein [Jeotgalibacillus sp. HH7-29]
MNENFRDQLMHWASSNHIAVKRQPLQQEKKPRGKEKLSQRDLRELMGADRQTYVRKRGGALKQR